MRFIHCADVHLDSKMETNLSKEKAAERKNELLATFEEMVKYACDEEMQGVLISGDLFDTTEVEQKNIKRRVGECIRNHPDMEFYYLQGNHDRSGFLQYLKEVPDNLHLFGQEYTSYRCGDVVITGRELSSKTTNSPQDGLVLREEDVNIVMLHGQDSRYEQKGNAEVLSMRSFTGKYIDYLALGHIHSFKLEKLDTRGDYCYSGCLEGRGFDECGEKGFVELLITDHKIEAKFHPFAKRTLHEVVVPLDSVTTESEILLAIADRIAPIASKDLVKIILSGEVTPELDIDINYLTHKVEDRFYYVKIYNQTEAKINYEDYANEISLKGEFIRGVYLENLDDKEKNKIILTGIKALMGRDLSL